MTESCHEHYDRERPFGAVHPHSVRRLRGPRTNSDFPRHDRPLKPPAKRPANRRSLPRSGGDRRFFNSVDFILFELQG